MSAPTINTQPADCPKCEVDATVVPMDIVEEQDAEETTFTLSYRCISCGTWYNPKNP